MGVVWKIVLIPPHIGNNLWIGPGAKLFGKIDIADNCQIGANAVVNKTFDIHGSAIVGCPAKVVKVMPTNHSNY